MPLNLNRLYGEIEQFARSIPELHEQEQAIDAQTLLNQADPDELRRRLEQREGSPKIPWLIAKPVATLSSRFKPPPLPNNISVVAADGSSIPPDRHSSVRYYVINTGYVVLTYGETPDALLDAHANFCFEDHELFFDPEGKRIPIEGTRLGILMGIEEMEGLQAATELALPPTVAIRDGSMILWNLQSEESTLKQDYLDRYLMALNALRDAEIPVCSYISFPGGQDVVNALRLVLCDDLSRQCGNCPQETEQQIQCQQIGHLRDRQIFGKILRTGERSDIFESLSAILDDYGHHHIQFFYLNVGDEISRVEAPRWVMNDPDMLNLVHGVIVDQCQRSSQYPPYPPALIEAHEQAVISTADRNTVESLIEQALAEQGIYYVRSAKDRSKRGRGV